MSDVVSTHRETALESPYARDRESAIEELAAVYADAGTGDRRTILETLREIALEASSRSERDLAREQLLSCFEVAPAEAGPVAVETFRAIATDSTSSGERESAIDTLRNLCRDAPGQREEIEATLQTVAEEATREAERQRAQRRLSDLAGDPAASGDRESEPDSSDYLGVSLAEHLESAADDSAAACRRRATELRDFVVNNPLGDDRYPQIREDLESLVDQLEVLPTGDAINDDRRARIRDVAARVKRLYTRGESTSTS